MLIHACYSFWSSFYILLPLSCLFHSFFKCSLQVNYFVCLASTPHNVEHWEAIYQNIGFAQMATQMQTRTQEAGKKTPLTGVLDNIERSSLHPGQ